MRFPAGRGHCQTCRQAGEEASPDHGDSRNRTLGKAHLDTVTERAAAPVIAKYTGVLAAADIGEFTTSTTFQIMQSLRLDRGPSGPVHP
jgi:hypothetical protein